MIYRYDDDTLSRWNKGEFKVQLMVPNSNRPFGYCEGTDEDEQELLSLAEEEGAEGLEIQKKYLWTGREIWTLASPENTAVDDDFDDF